MLECRRSLSGITKEAVDFSASTASIEFTNKALIFQ